MAKILVTGSSGTIGTRLCEKLIEKGHEILCVDCVENKWNEEINKITILIDLQDRDETFQKLSFDVDMIIHLAASARVPYSIKEPSLACTNLKILSNVLEFVRLRNIPKLMFASSKDVYGNYREICSEEDVRIEACESPYGASKIGGEALVHAYHKCYGLDFLTFRISNVYGMYDAPDRLIPIFIKLTKEGNDLVVNGKEKGLDFIHIDDVADGIIMCLEKFDQVKNDTYNLAYGEETPLLKIAELVKTNLQGNNHILIGESKPGEVVRSVSNISKAREKIGFSPKIGIDEGMKMAVKWNSENSQFYD